MISGLLMATFVLLSMQGTFDVCLVQALPIKRGNTENALQPTKQSFNGKTEKSSTTMVSKFSYDNGAVASDTPICSKIGTQMLQNGGSAVDGAVATALCLGVVSPFSSGIGGGGYMIVVDHGDHDNSNTIEAIDFRETAPSNTYKLMFYNRTRLSVDGGLAIAVPGEIKGLYYAQQRYGKLLWEEVLQPIIDLAEYGFEVTNTFAQMLHLISDSLDDPRFSVLKQMLTNKTTGRYVESGEILKRPELANTLRILQKKGEQVFYQGWIAKKLVEEINNAGGNITLEDFKNYNLMIRKPIRFNYKEFQMITMPPSSSGGTLLSFVLNVLSNIDISLQTQTQLGYSQSTLHYLVEAFKFAFANRGALGDPLFVQNVTDIVNSLLSKDFGLKIAKNISESTTYPPEYYGKIQVPPNDHGTSHLCVMTKTQTVSMTTTVNFNFGSKIASKTTGIILNNQMNDFSVSDQPNGFGIAPSQANSVEPGKRPLSSMSPTIVLENNKPYIAVGASGGPTIITTIVQVLINLLHFGMNVDDAVSRPRLHHQHLPNYVQIERTYPEWLVTGLKNRGHDVRILNGTLADGQNLGNCQLVVYKENKFYAASDPRKGGIPAGF